MNCQTIAHKPTSNKIGSTLRKKLDNLTVLPTPSQIPNKPQPEIVPAATVHTTPSVTMPPQLPAAAHMPYHSLSQQSLYTEDHDGAWNTVPIFPTNLKWWDEQNKKFLDEQNARELTERQAWSIERKEKAVKALYSSPQKATFTYNTTDTSDSSESERDMTTSYQPYAHDNSIILSQNPWSKTNEIRTRMEKAWITYYTNSMAILPTVPVSRTMMGQKFYPKDKMYDTQKLATIHYEHICPGVDWIPSCPFILQFTYKESARMPNTESIYFPLQCEICHDIIPTLPSLTWEYLQHLKCCLTCKAHQLENEREQNGEVESYICLSYQDILSEDYYHQNSNQNPRWHPAEIKDLKKKNWRQQQRLKTSLSCKEWNQRRAKRKRSLILYERTRLKASNSHTAIVTFSPKKPKYASKAPKVPKHPALIKAAKRSANIFKGVKP